MIYKYRKIAFIQSYKNTSSSFDLEMMGRRYNEKGKIPTFAKKGVLGAKTSACRIDIEIDCTHTHYKLPSGGEELKAAN